MYLKEALQLRSLEVWLDAGFHQSPASFSSCLGYVFFCDGVILKLTQHGERMTFTMFIINAHLAMPKSSDNVLGRLPRPGLGHVPAFGRVEPASSESLGMRRIPMKWEWDGLSKKMQYQADGNYVSYSLASQSVAHRSAAAAAPGSC